VDLALSDEQRELVASFANLFAKSSPPELVRAAEPVGFDATLWRTLLDTGAVTMGVAEAHGGWGASLLDLVLVAEQLGRAVAPAPLLEAQVAARLLAAVGSPAALDALAPVLEGEQLVSLAVRPVRGGVAALAPAGAVCDALVVLDGDALRLVPVTDEHRTVVDNLASAPLADVRLGGGTVLADGPAAVAAFEVATDEWLALVAAALVGSGTVALEIGCRYAIERRAFGQAIGSFQGVSHPLADDATSLDGARLLVHKAAWELDRGGARGRELAAMAFAFASTSAEQATYDALHTHGGYGFMLEYDVQLHWRRVRGWPRVWGDADAAYARAGAARYVAAKVEGEEA
jgi:alkylation response protein AidB-like acyl-CoA dehydrogenase